MLRRADYLRLRRGRRISKPCFTLQVLSNEQEFARVGLTVTKKLGNAVHRNRIKRRFRAAIRDTFPLYAQAGRDYVIMARKQALTVSYATLLDELRAALLDPRDAGGAAAASPQNPAGAP